MIRKKIAKFTRSHLKIRILAQVQGGAEFQPEDILKYFEELKRGPNTEIGTKDFFEMASKLIERSIDSNIRQIGRHPPQASLETVCAVEIKDCYRRSNRIFIKNRVPINFQSYRRINMVKYFL